MTFTTNKIRLQMQKDLCCANVIAVKLRQFYDKISDDSYPVCH